MEVDQALRALTMLRDAAPPTTAARLSDVITVVNQLHDENTTLFEQISAFPIIDLMPQMFAALKPSMQIIRGQTDALRAGKLGRITTEQADCLKLVYEHAASALAMVQSLDEISLLHQGLLPMEPLVFSGLDLLAEAWQHQSEAAEVRDHHVHIHADDPLPSIQGDYRYILSVLNDLLDNAVRYTPFSGMIRITAETLGTHVLFSVADNGIGFTPEDLEHVGQPFWRALHQPLVRQHPGTGLRLYLAKEILEAHGSELLFSGEPGMGSTFSFALSVG